MEKLKITLEKAIEAYKNADTNGKKLLEDLFGKEKFSTKSIIERVQSIEDIYLISGKRLVKRNEDTDDEFAYRQAKLIAEVYNEGTVLDPMDTNQKKYYPWHKIAEGSGFGLSYFDFAYWLSVTRIGFRLCFKTSALAIDAGNKFIEIYYRLKIK